jgi:hypothetical protein
LEDIETQARGRSATVYASPAFWQANDLWSNVRSQSIIAQSNIAAVNKLRGHDRFTYTGPGNFGRGHSEPVGLESPTFEQVVGSGANQDELPFNQHIKRAAKDLEEGLRSSEFGSKILDQVQYVLLGNEAVTPEARDNSAVIAMQKVELISDALGVSFFAIG